MPTHPHLLVETPYGGLGRWMQLLLADYARYYNRSHGRSGHLFQARYKILVEDGEYLLECSRYIHLNPNRKKLTRPAELWPWSSYRNFVGGPVAVDWVSTDRILAHFGSPEDYRAYVESGRDEKPISPFERATAGRHSFWCVSVRTVCAYGTRPPGRWIGEHGWPMSPRRARSRHRPSGPESGPDGA